MVWAFPDALVRDVRWTQEQDGVFAARIDLSTPQQWGYQTFYEGNTFVLQIKAPPPIDRARPLQGRRIVVDAGHGGSETGAPGALGVDEKDLMLPIALRLAQLLRERGAEVVLTRQSDVRVPLAERPLLAEKVGAEVLLSVHANALPDGVDPRTQRGVGVYYYQPQARALADVLMASLIRRVPEAGNDGLHFQNLALTRPTSQLSILVETAFMTDKGNLRLLMSAQGREKFAQSLALGLEEFYRLNATRPTPGPR
jgi:N-acetylmuramoyl-L-alanine amidase